MCLPPFFPLLFLWGNEDVSVPAREEHVLKKIGAEMFVAPVTTCPVSRRAVRADTVP